MGFQFLYFCVLQVWLALFKVVQGLYQQILLAGRDPKVAQIGGWVCFEKVERLVYTRFFSNKKLHEGDLRAFEVGEFLGLESRELGFYILFGELNCISSLCLFFFQGLLLLIEFRGVRGEFEKGHSERLTNLHDFVLDHITFSSLEYQNEARIKLFRFILTVGLWDIFI